MDTNLEINSDFYNNKNEKQFLTFKSLSKMYLITRSICNEIEDY